MNILSANIFDGLDGCWILSWNYVVVDRECEDVSDGEVLGESMAVWGISDGVETLIQGSCGISSSKLPS